MYPDFENFLISQGFKDEEDFRQYFELNLYREAAARAAVTVTDEEIQAAYDEKYKKEDSSETESTEESSSTETEKTEEIPTLDEVKDELKEKVIQDKLTNEFIVSTLAKEREEAGFALMNDFLEKQYMELSSTYNEVKDTDSSVIAKVNDHEYTVEQLYDELIPVYGLSDGISLIDTDILENKYSVEDKSKKQLMSLKFN